MSERIVGFWELLLTALVHALLPSQRRARRKRRLQRQRRRALWLAVHGIDVGPRRIHGVVVRA
ncbi:hypothetical protein [Streptomyces sp. STR69]|uniref:hypothetical protein n=1 Tax=Streptomyces sp. STR69 TaxID=1796942 RepID=UPI0021C9D107|nr:hypothetical protein [Streptomyces sp. STR69]